MDVVSSVAALGQLLGQAISLWQQVEIARESVRAAPKLLRDASTQLSNLSDIVHQVERELDLHTPEICPQLRTIETVASELCRLLEKMTTRQRRSSIRRGFRALRLPGRDEAKLRDVLQRLENSKAELTLRVNVVHVGMTGGCVKGIERLVEGSDLSEKGSDGRNYFSLEGNKAADESDQLNGIAGMERLQAATTAKVTENHVLGKSRQRNLILGENSKSQLFQGWDDNPSWDSLDHRIDEKQN